MLKKESRIYAGSGVSQTPIVEYEGKEYRLSAGESFRFEKNGLHSVKADGPYKMALLLVL